MKDEYSSVILKYLNTKNDLRVIRFNMRDIYIKNRAVDSNKCIESARKQMSKWLSTQIQDGSFRIGNFDVELYAIGNPNKYQAVRAEQ